MEKRQQKFKYYDTVTESINITENETKIHWRKRKKKERNGKRNACTQIVETITLS